MHDRARVKPPTSKPRAPKPPTPKPPKSPAAWTFDPLDVVVLNGNTCPANYREVTFAQAQQHQDAICSKLGEWYIARLAGGGSMDGPGYPCKLRPSDERSLDHVLCAR